MDENLSPRLVQRLHSLFGQVTHVRSVGLKMADDLTIWEWAKRNEYSIVTTDADFVALSKSRGWPPKVIHIRRCNYPGRVIEDLLRRNAIRIAEFVGDEKGFLLSL